MSIRSHRECSVIAKWVPREAVVRIRHSLHRREMGRDEIFDDEIENLLGRQFRSVGPPLLDMSSILGVDSALLTSRNSFTSGLSR